MKVGPTLFPPTDQTSTPGFIGNLCYIQTLIPQLQRKQLIIVYFSRLDLAHSLLTMHDILC